MVDVLLRIGFGGLSLTWFCAVYYAWVLLRYRRADLSVSKLAFNGYLFFKADSFRPEGHPVHRRFMWAVLAFAGGILGVGLLGVLSVVL
jgi:hypothetical protein